MTDINISLEKIKHIRQLIVISLFSDDKLMDTFVLKGGNAIDIIYNISDRTSIDIDLSMENDFNAQELDNIRTRIDYSLNKTFADHGMEVFDVSLAPKPKILHSDIQDFWGGYILQFKIIEKEKFSHLTLEKSRKQALPLGSRRSTAFKVDISKFEYCGNKQAVELDNYTIYVYSPLMLVYEKLRAICQQSSTYVEIVHQKPCQRARDFFDIYTLVTNLNLESIVVDLENITVLEAIFTAKRVPLRLLLEIPDQIDFHAENFQTVMATVSNHKNLKPFAFYADYVINLAEKLHSLWNK